MEGGNFSTFVSYLALLGELRFVKNFYVEFLYQVFVVFVILNNLFSLFFQLLDEDKKIVVWIEARLRSLQLLGRMRLIRVRFFLFFVVDVIWVLGSGILSEDGVRSVCFLVVYEDFRKVFFRGIWDFVC